MRLAYSSIRQPKVKEILKNLTHKNCVMQVNAIDIWLAICQKERTDNCQYRYYFPKIMSEINKIKAEQIHSDICSCLPLLNI